MPSVRVALAVALLTAVTACQSPRSGQTRSGQPTPQPAVDPKAPVAKWSGGTITAGDLDDAAKKDLRRMEAEYQEGLYRARKAALDQLVAQKLVEEKARAAGLATEELVNREVTSKVAEPSEGEISALYERARAGGQQLPPLDQVKADIARYIKQQNTQEALRAFHDKLKAEANVEVLLPPYKPPRVEVSAEGPSKGPSGAKVTIVEFSDFECPYCSRGEETVKQILATYGDKVRIVYRDFPLPMHANAKKAAEAAHCAGDQSKYWEMHEKLFANQRALGVGALKGYARDLGLEQGRFDKCLDSGEKGRVVDSHAKAGEEAGVSGTPAFFVNGMLLSGAQPFESFKGLIDAELASAK